MDDLPLLPKTKSAWIACFVLILVLFWCYYTFLYPGYLESYEEQNHVITYTVKQNDSLTKDFEIRLIVPKSLGADIVQYATVSIHNLQQDSVHLKIQLIWEKKDQNIEGTDLAIMALADAIEPKDASVQVRPNSYEFVRLPLFFLGDSINLKEELLAVTVLTPQGDSIGEEILSADEEAISDVNRMQSSLHFILKEILLPPLANVVLAGLAIILCWFFEESRDKNKPEDQTKVDPKYESVDRKKAGMVFVQSAPWAFALVLLLYFLEVQKLIFALLLALLMGILIYIFKQREVLLEFLRELIQPDRSDT